MILATLPRFHDNKDEKNPWRYAVEGGYGREMSKIYGFDLISLYPPNCLAACAFCDGLLLPGSTQDIKSMYWGEDWHNPEHIYDEYAHDAIVIDYFIKAGKPIFGVCGGLQALNVFLGGSLKKAIFTETIEDHRDADELHTIDIKEGSFVHDAFGATEARVNSMHAWVIDRLAPSLTVVATCRKDGLIEAVENREMGIFATQWHPEQVYNEMGWVPEKYSSPAERTMFENFFALCEERKKQRGE